jgi:hypothetical protein|tara:strand:- start:431 stop:838 length:408 start_codon:yes stop_codon:yes gene_type:complete
MVKKGSKSKTRPGDLDYTTKRGDKDYHEGGRDVKKKKAPFSKRKVPRPTAMRKTPKIKLEKTTTTLGGSKVTFMKGGLHKSLKVPMSYKFTRARMAALNKHEDGKTFSFQGKRIKMTPKIHKQLVLGMNLMGRKR